MQVIQGDNDTENCGYSHFIRLSARDLLHAGLLYALFFDREDGSDMLLRNVGWILPDFIAEDLIHILHMDLVVIVCSTVCRGLHVRGMDFCQQESERDVNIAKIIMRALF
jgi:hypothetical protein